MTVQVVAPGRDGYRHAIWLVPTDGSAPARQVTLGARHDTQPRFSPDGTALAFLSDRRPLVEEEPAAPKDREDGTQVHLLPLAGGEARRLTDLPRGVDAFEWSPDGRSLVVRTTSFGATRDEDRKAAAQAGAAEAGRDRRTPTTATSTGSRTCSTGPASSTTRSPTSGSSTSRRAPLAGSPTGRPRTRTPAWSPDGTRIAFAASRGRDHDLDWQFDVFVVEVATGARHPGHRRPPAASSARPTWLPDGRTLAVVGHRFPRGGGSRNDVWLFPADGCEARPGGGRNLSGRHDLMVGCGMGSDVTPGEATRIRVTPDGSHLLVTAPGPAAPTSCGGSPLADGAARAPHRRPPLPLRLGGRAGRRRRPARSRRSARPRPRSPTSTSSTSPRTGASRAGSALRRVTGLQRRGPRRARRPRARGALGDRRRAGDPGLADPLGGGARRASRPRSSSRSTAARTRSTAGRRTGSSRCSRAPGSASCSRTRAAPRATARTSTAPTCRDWGAGPMRDVMAHVEALVAAGVADPARLGVTGGSYGGYLTNWIVGHTDRFAAAMTCRSVSDLTSLMLTGDLAGGIFGIMEFGAQPWENAGALPRAVADHLRRPGPRRRCSSSTPRTTCAARSARRRRSSRPADAEAPGPPHAGPERVARADPLRHAVPARREPGPGPVLVRPLPRPGQEAAPAAAGRTAPGSDRARRARSWARDPAPARRRQPPRGRPGRRRGDRPGPPATRSPSTPRCRPGGRARSSSRSPARYRAATLAATPWLVEEIDGAAEGAGVDPLALFAASIEEIWAVRPSQAGTAEPVPGRCSDLVVGPPLTADGHLWVAHNNDLGEESEPQVVAVEWRVPGEPVVFSLGIGPWISVGWNDAGLSLTGNELSPNDERVGVPRLLMVREQLTARDARRGRGDGPPARPGQQLQHGLRAPRRAGRRTSRGAAATPSCAASGRGRRSPTRTTTSSRRCCATRATRRTPAARPSATSAPARSWPAAASAPPGAVTPGRPPGVALGPRRRPGFALPAPGRGPAGGGDADGPARRGDDGDGGSTREDGLLGGRRRDRRRGPVRPRQPVRRPRAGAPRLRVIRCGAPRPPVR